MTLFPTLLISLAGVISPAAAADPLIAWPDLDTAAPLVGGGAADAAVVIAIENYGTLDDIPGAVANGEAWVHWLARARGVPLSHLHHLYDGEAVDQTIRETITAAAREVGNGGTLWVVFIGHGAPAVGGKDVVLVGADAQSKASLLYARSVPRSELLAAVQPGRKGLFILDSCFSGKGMNDARLTDDPLAPVIPVEALTTPPAVAVLYGAGEGQFGGPLPGIDRPAFSYLALGALRGWADADGDHQVSTIEVRDYANGVMNMVVEGRSQTADAKGPIFLFPLTHPETGPDLFPRGPGGPPIPKEVAAPTTPPAPPPRRGTLPWVVGAGAVAGGAGALLGGFLTEQSFHAADAEGVVTGDEGARMQRQANILYGAGYGAVALGGAAGIWGPADGRPTAGGVTLQVGWRGRW